MLADLGSSALSRRAVQAASEAGANMFEPNLAAGDDSSALERRLRAWEPSPGGLDRDRMLFEAGRAAAASEMQGWRSRRPWLLAASAAALVASVLGAAWTSERSDRIQLELALRAVSQRPSGLEAEAQIEVAAAPLLKPDPAETPRPIESSSYLALVRRLVLSPGTAEQTSHGAHAEPRRPPAPTLPVQETRTLGARDLKRVISL